MYFDRKKMMTIRLFVSTKKWTIILGNVTIIFFKSNSMEYEAIANLHFSVELSAVRFANKNQWHAKNRAHCRRHRVKGKEFSSVPIPHTFRAPKIHSVYWKTAAIVHFAGKMCAPNLVANRLYRICSSRGIQWIRGTCDAAERLIPVVNIFPDLFGVVRETGANDCRSPNRTQKILITTTKFNFSIGKAPKCADKKQSNLFTFLGGSKSRPILCPFTNFVCKSTNSL